MRHFKGTRKASRPTYLQFVERYQAFHEEDCVELCGNHHEEIHVLYWREFERLMLEGKIKPKPFYRWTWGEARWLIRHYQKVCDDWLKTTTSGTKGRKYTTYD